MSCLNCMNASGLCRDCEEYLYPQATNEEKIEFGLAIINCLLTDSQLDFRNKNQGTGRLSKLIRPNESIRKAAIRIYGN